MLNLRHKGEIFYEFKKQKEKRIIRGGEGIVL